MTAATLTLTDFLLARIAEDAERPCPRHGIRDCSPLLNGCSLPNKQARECEAKRRIVEDFTEYDRDYRAAPSPFAEGRRFAALLAVSRAAAVYSAHPDYRDEWKP